VKRYCGDDSWGVAPCQNSSMPSLIFIRRGLTTKLVINPLLLCFNVTFFCNLKNKSGIRSIF
jgi:hypothetical protein